MRAGSTAALFLALLFASPATAQLPDDPMLAPIPGEEVAAAPEPGPPSDGPTAWAGVGFHGSLLTDRIDRSNLNLRFGYQLSAGARFGRLGLFGTLEQDFWVQTELDLRVSRGVLNIGVGGEYFYARDRVRLALTVGLSILLGDQALDPAPSFGLFGEFKPTGLRWSRGRWWTVSIDPIVFAIVAPVLRSPRLYEIQYRVALTLEWQSPGGRRALGE